MSERASTRGRERPILFSAPMVRALLAGTKTQTRRILKPQPNGDVIHYGWQAEGGAFWTDQNFESRRIPIWTGDRLWVREAWACHWSTDDQKPSDIDPRLWSVRYFADDHICPAQADGSVARLDQFKRKRPSMFMPRWASRLTLTVSDVRVQRLQEISREDAASEGLTQLPATKRWVVAKGDQYFGMAHRDPRVVYEILWEQINGAGSWAANPWVAAYTFTVERRNIDEGLGQRADATPKNPLSEGRERS